MMRSFVWVKNQSVEVFPDPNKDRTRLFANEVFALYEEVNGEPLDWETPNGDRLAHQYLKVALDCQIDALDRWSEGWREELRDIRAAIVTNPEGNLALLYALAWDGGGPRPEGETFGWVDRLEPWPPGERA
jgi:hypothetical protein